MNDETNRSWETYATILAKDDGLDEVLAECRDRKLRIKGESVSIQVDGSHIRVHIPSYDICAQMLSVEPFISEGAPCLERLCKALTEAGQTVRVLLGDQVVATLGAEGKLGSVARLMKIRHLRGAKAPPSIITVRDKKPSRWRILALGAVVISGLAVYQRKSHGD